MQAAGQLAQLLQRELQLLRRPGEQLLRRVGIGAELGLRQAQRERERDEPLLGAVVQVPLEPAALGVGGLDEARARALQLGELHLQLPLQPVSLQRQTRSRECCLEQLAFLEQRRVVLDQGERPCRARPRTRPRLGRLRTRRRRRTAHRHRR